MCLTDHPDEPRPVPEARRLRPEAVRAAAAHLRRRLARDVREVRSDSQPQDRHQQPRAVQHRQHRLQLRLSRSVLRAPPRDHPGARDLSEGLAVLHRQRSARAEGRADGDAASGAWPKDEFKDNGDWPHQIYVREARRMIGAYVMTENELLKKRSRRPTRSAWARYTIDSHNVQRYITPEGYVQNEGDIGVPHQAARTRSPTARSCPKRGQADNLLVPVCVSSSHIAFGTIRMEPVFMILGQSRRDRRRAGDRRQARRAGRAVSRSCASGCWRTARCWNTRSRRPPRRREVQELPRGERLAASRALARAQRRHRIDA